MPSLPATTDEIRAITELWIETWPCGTNESKAFANYLTRSLLVETARRILTGELPITNRTSESWRALLPMLAAYRAGKVSGAG